MLPKLYWTILVICLLSNEVGGKFFGIGRGSSGARSSSSSRPAGTGYRPSGSPSNYGIGRNTGGYPPRNNNYNNIGRNTGYNNNNIGRNTGNKGGFFGNRRNNNNNNYGRGSMPTNSRYTKGSGIGSALRSNTFKNMIVGAAAGYLAYQGGKFLIRNAMSPMMWNNRPYYWGSNYYQPRPNTQMCRMPMEGSDSQLGQVYFSDQTRPREIVWGCGYNEHCCGYECCPNGMGGGMGAGMGSGMGMNNGGMGMNNGGMGAATGGAAYGAMSGNNGQSETALEHSMSVRPSQAVGVRGQLRCNGAPASGVLVKLYDHDTFTLDDKIASGRTDGQGGFFLGGHAHEYTTITPKLNIYHDCNDNLPCQRKVSIYVPKEYVTKGDVAQRVYDIGSMELAGQVDGESRDCLH